MSEYATSAHFNSVSILGVVSEDKEGIEDDTVPALVDNSGKVISPSKSINSNEPNQSPIGILVRTTSDTDKQTTSRAAQDESFNAMNSDVEYEETIKFMGKEKDDDLSCESDDLFFGSSHLSYSEHDEAPPVKPELKGLIPNDDVREKSSPYKKQQMLNFSSTQKIRKQQSHHEMTCRARIGNFFKRIWFLLRNPYETYVDVMYYVFNLSFGMLMFYFTIIFYVICIVFTFLIYAVGMIEPECILFDGQTLDQLSRSNWLDGCWTLSWTTLTTVGYGNTAPNVAYSDGEIVLDDPEKCIAINTLLMLISFFGVVYSGAAGAILYSKVEKIKSEGQVSFSDPCVVRFGSGLIPIGAEDETHSKKSKKLCPCPVLEFRILNHNHHTSMGVIANSELHCLASVEDERTRTKEDGGDEDIFGVGEDKRVNLPRRLFSTMKLINGEHPFFRRCWTATHVIDENSPLIKKKMRDIIKANDGFWPKKSNNAEAIKKHLRFKEIIVNFTGVSKRTSKDVHAQRVYDINDVLVGYQFINVLKKNETNVEVRGDLLNDITEQNGSDAGEKLTDRIVTNF